MAYGLEPEEGANFRFHSRSGALRLEDLRLPELGAKPRELLDLIATIKGSQIPNIELPQIAVVGEQSAGKSAALAATSGIPFPSKADTCTRYVTEIRLIKADFSRYRVKIIADEKRSAETRTRFEQFGRGFHQNTTFEKLFGAASAEITSRSRKSITGEMLVVERFDKDTPNLTLIDLPGPRSGLE